MGVFFDYSYGIIGSINFWKEEGERSEDGKGEVMREVGILFGKVVGEGDV